MVAPDRKGQDGQSMVDGERQFISVYKFYF